MNIYFCGVTFTISWSLIDLRLFLTKGAWFCMSRHLLLPEPEEK